MAFSARRAALHLVSEDQTVTDGTKETGGSAEGATRLNGSSLAAFPPSVEWLTQPNPCVSAGLATKHTNDDNPLADYSGMTVATTEVLPAGGVKPAGCVIEMVVVPTASGSKAVLR